MIRFLLLLTALFAAVGSSTSRRLPTLTEVRSWPATVSIATAVGPIGISRSYGFELARVGQFPCRVIRVGSRYRVVTASLVALLESDATSDEPQGAA